MAGCKEFDSIWYTTLMIEGIVEFNQELTSIFDQLPRDRLVPKLHTSNFNPAEMARRCIEEVNQRTSSPQRKDLLQSLKNLLARAEDTITPTLMSLIPYEVHQLYITGVPEDLNELADDVRVIFCILPDHPFDTGLLSKETAFPRERLFIERELRNRMGTNAFVQGILDGRIQREDSLTIRALPFLNKLPDVERDPEYERPKIGIHTWRSEFHDLHGQYP